MITSDITQSINHDLGGSTIRSDPNPSL